MRKYSRLYEDQSRDYHDRNKRGVAKGQIAMVLNNGVGYSFTDMISGSYVRSLTLPKLESFCKEVNRKSNRM